MISDRYFWLNIVILGVGTLAIRGSIIAVSARVRISDRMKELFSFIPAAILPALVAPAVFFHRGKVAFLFGKERFVVTVLAAVVCYFSRSTLATIVFVLVILYLFGKDSHMNGAHLHLIVNHVSLFALIFGAAMLGAHICLKRKSSDLRLVATVLFLVAGVFGWVAVETGEKAEEIVKTLHGVSAESFIDEHAMAATWGLRWGIFVAALALVLEWAVWRKKKAVRLLQWALLIFSIVGCSVFARTAYLGGQIRHTEVRN